MERPLTETAGALEGLRVLDLSRVLAGPLCTMILADLGADVIKVERPGSGDDTRQWGPPWAGDGDGAPSAYFLSINRNKRSITADLSSDAGRDLVRKLAEQADILVENFAPGTAERFGLGYESLAEANPALIFCSITGYGSSGPDAGRPGYDFAVQARAGWMFTTGDDGGEPMKAGVALVDVLTGQNVAIAILAAVEERHRSGRGQRLEVALIDSAAAGLVNVAQAALVGKPTRRWGNAHPNIVPYQTFNAADRPIAIAVGNDTQWRRLCGVLGLEHIADDPRFESNPKRVENREILLPIIERRVRQNTADEWIDRLVDAAIPCAPVQTVAEAVRDPALRERDGIWTMLAEYGEIETVASPLRLERTPARLRRPAPTLGEHTDEIERHGWSDETRPLTHG